MVSSWRRKFATLSSDQNVETDSDRRYFGETRNVNLKVSHNITAERQYSDSDVVETVKTLMLT